MFCTPYFLITSSFVFTSSLFSFSNQLKFYQLLHQNRHCLWNDILFPQLPFQILFGHFLVVQPYHEILSLSCDFQDQHRAPLCSHRKRVFSLSRSGVLASSAESGLQIRIGTADFHDSCTNLVRIIVSEPNDYVLSALEIPTTYSKLRDGLIDELLKGTAKLEERKIRADSL